MNLINFFFFFFYYYYRELYGDSLQWSGYGSKKKKILI